jgi:hypothetical protein
VAKSKLHGHGVAVRIGKLKNKINDYIGCLLACCVSTTTVFPKLMQFLKQVPQGCPVRDVKVST